MKVYFAAALVLLLGISVHAYPEIWELTGGQSAGIGHGFNIRTMHQTPFSLLEYDNFADSINVNGQRYGIPRETFGGSKMLIRNETQSVIMKNFQDVYNMKAKNWGVSVGVTLYGVGVDLAYSRLRGEINALTKNGTSSFVISSYTWHAFDLEVDWRDVSLDSDFVYDVKSLPLAYNYPIYRKFIEAYGTHFFTQAAYGCRYNYTLSFKSNLETTKGSSWTGNQIGIAVSYTFGAFGFSIGVDFEKYKNTTKQDTEFRNNSQGKVVLHGGDETLLNKGLNAWYETCKKQRVVLLEKSKILPIAELVRFDNARKQNIIQALKQYAANP